jgi:lysophospholipase L1-like esterase
MKTIPRLLLLFLATAVPCLGTAGEGVSELFGKVLRGSTRVPGCAGFRQRPLTVECWARLDSATGFNILVSSDTQASAEHWELYSYANSGVLSLYQSGRGGEIKSDANVCDGKWHYLAAVIEPERVRLFVDGVVVKDAPATPLQGEPLPGDLSFGNLIEGIHGCAGAVDNVRISSGVRNISGVPTGPLVKDAATLGLWDFEETAPARIASTVPVPRVDAGGVARQSQVLQRAKDSPGECDIAFIGDSITQGWEAAGEPWQKFYGNRRCLNFGVVGDLTENVLWRLENGQIDGINPKVVVLMIGTNNTLRDSEADILAGVQAIVKQICSRLPETKVLLLGIFPRGRTFDAQRGKILQVNQALAKMADGKNIFFMDFGPQLIEADGSISPSVMPDSLHLSGCGYEIWAEAIEPKLKELLQK